MFIISEVIIFHFIMADSVVLLSSPVSWKGTSLGVRLAVVSGVHHAPVII